MPGSGAHEVRLAGLRHARSARLTGTRARDPDAAIVKDLSTYGVPAVGSEFDVIYCHRLLAPARRKRYRVFNMAEGSARPATRSMSWDLDRLDDIRRYRWRRDRARPVSRGIRPPGRRLGGPRLRPRRLGCGSSTISTTSSSIQPLPAASMRCIACCRMSGGATCEAMERRRELLLALRPGHRQHLRRSPGSPSGWGARPPSFPIRSTANSSGSPPG